MFKIPMYISSFYIGQESLKRLIYEMSSRTLSSDEDLVNDMIEGDYECILRISKKIEDFCNDIAFNNHALSSSAS
jgi:hypothetical protein